MLHFCCVSVKVCERKAIGNSVPLYSCDSCASHRFVDDAWVIQQQAHKELFLDHINSVDPAIKFTVKGNQEDGALPFLDTLVRPMADNPTCII